MKNHILAGFLLLSISFYMHAVETERSIEQDRRLPVLIENIRILSKNYWPFNMYDTIDFSETTPFYKIFTPSVAGYPISFKDSSNTQTPPQSVQEFYTAQDTTSSDPDNPHLKHWWYMYMALVKKFEQYPQLKDFLLSTYNKKLVYETNNDIFWGINNKTRKGNNYLGILLMIIRRELQISLLDIIRNYRKNHLIPFTDWRTLANKEDFYVLAAPYQFRKNTTAVSFTVNDITYFSLEDYFIRSQAYYSIDQKLKGAIRGMDLISMYEGVKAQLTTYPVLKNALLVTAHKILIYNDFTSNYWGIGKEGTGHNYLGIIYMVLRNEFNNEYAVTDGLRKKIQEATITLATKKAALKKLSWREYFTTNFAKARHWLANTFKQLFGYTSNPKDTQ